MGCFITFEGPEGGGKTTQLGLLHQYLQKLGYATLAVREPGSTSIGDQIREILHNPKNSIMSPGAELLLYSAARAQLVNERIGPSLGMGTVVLCDRYADSTLAYQGYGHGLDLRLLNQITRFATGGLRPDLIIYLDIAPQEGLRRKQDAYRAGKGEWNRMDQQEIDFHQRVRRGYLKLIRREPSRWFRLDATLDPAFLHRSIRERVLAALTERHILPTVQANAKPEKEAGASETHT